VNATKDRSFDTVSDSERSWPKFRPIADRRSLEAAARLGLPDDQGRLCRLARGADFARSTSFLVRVDLDGADDDVRRAAEASRR
jgi:hypothetical protein